MRSLVCPDGHGSININLEPSEVTDLLKNLLYIKEEFNWDEYILDMLRGVLRSSLDEIGSEAPVQERIANDSGYNQPYNPEDYSGAPDIEDRRTLPDGFAIESAIDNYPLSETDPVE